AGKGALAPCPPSQSSCWLETGGHAALCAPDLLDGPPPLVVPANALGDAHIFEAPSSDGGVEVFEAVLHGDGTWRLGRRVTVPAAEPTNDPGGPRERVGGGGVS